MENAKIIDYLAIIPARGGSKRLPGKNIKHLNGKPLIAYAIKSGLESKKVSHTIVSTDDEQIASCAKEHGADVPFLRPADISGDKSSVVDALLHAVEFFEKQGCTVRNVVLLQVTSPFRTAAHVDTAITAFETGKADTLTTVSPARNHPYYALKDGTQAFEPFFDKEKLAMRAFELPPAVYENGVVFVMETQSLKKNGIYGIKNMVCELDSPNLTIDIDTAFDFELAEFLMQKSGGAQ